MAQSAMLPRSGDFSHVVAVLDSDDMSQVRSITDLMPGRSVITDMSGLKTQYLPHGTVAVIYVGNRDQAQELAEKINGGDSD